MAWSLELKENEDSEREMMTEIQLNVMGITCCGCVKGIQKALSVLYGVDDIDVDISSGTVTVTGDEAKLSRALLVEAIQSVGFSVQVE